jgi:hypothetical protein
VFHRPSNARLLVAGAIVSLGVAAVIPSVASARLSHLTEADMRGAPTFEPELSLVANSRGDFFFSTNLYQFTPTLSGDGNWIVHPVRLAAGLEGWENADLYRRSLVTGARERIDTGGESTDPAVSDNGRHVVYQRYDLGSGQSAIRRWVAGVGNANLTPPGSPPAAYNRLPSISDVGTTIAWLSREGETPDRVKVWRNGQVMSKPAGERGFFIATDAMTVSGNGGHVFFNDVNGQPSRWDLSTGAVLAVADEGQVSDDGGLVAGSGPYLDDYALGSAATVYRVGGGAELLVRHPYFQFTPTLPPTFLSGDGSTLLLGAGEPFNEPSRGWSLHVVDIATASVRRAVLPFPSRPIALSDDGRRALLLEDNFDGEYRLWVAHLDPADAPLAFVTDLAQPQLSDQVRRLYRAVLHRRPSDAALLYWTRHRASGASLAWMADQMIVSPEFAATFGELQVENFVQQVLDNVVMRADAVEYIDLLEAGHTRGEIAAMISEDPRALWGRTEDWIWPPFPKDSSSWPSPPEAAQVWRLYDAYFLRRADQAGLNYWLDLYWTGTSLRVISDYMAASPEFERRYGSLTDAQFVDQVYLNVLGRSAEPSGRAYWVEQLRAGMTRGTMMIGFSDSPEFIRRTDSIPPGG